MIATWNALYWDDWAVYREGRQGTIKFFADCARCAVPFRGEIEGLLVDPGPWLMRLLVFAFHPMIAFLTYRFLRRTQWLSREEESIITLAALLLPMFGARIALIDYHYSFSLLLFTLGAWMALSPHRATRLASLAPIFWSMFTPSLQVFVTVLIGVLMTKLVLRQYAITLDRFLILVSLILLPFVHRYGLNLIYPELAVKDGYNTIRLSFLIRAVLVAGTLTLPLVAITFRKRNGRVAQRPVVLLAIGLAVLAVGTFPYLSVGHFPNVSDWILPLLPDQSDWNSRHQLLQPFGTAIIFLSISQMMQYRRAFVVFVLVASIVLNVATYSSYYLDSLKQKAVLSYLSQNDDVLEEAVAVVVEDSANDYNARNRAVRSYEWQAMVETKTRKELPVDSFSMDFCRTMKPDVILRITPTGGRLKGLIQRRAAVNVTVERLTTCR